MKIFAPLLSLFSVVLFAAEPSPQPQRRQGGSPLTASASNRVTVAPASQAPPILYKPPRLGSPRISTGPGTRGDGISLPACVLAPNHPGLTFAAQPVLFWYQTQTNDARMEVTLVVPGQPEPLLQLRYDSAPKTGLQRLDLKERGVTLQPGIEYRWSVAIVTDPERRSKDLVTTGVIKRLSPDAELTARLARTAPSEQAAVYAAEGIWYDALQTALDLVMTYPDTPEYRTQAASLNNQIGLTNIANYLALAP